MPAKAFSACICPLKGVCMHLFSTTVPWFSNHSYKYSHFYFLPPSSFTGTTGNISALLKDNLMVAAEEGESISYGVFPFPLTVSYLCIHVDFGSIHLSFISEMTPGKISVLVTLSCSLWHHGVILCLCLWCVKVYEITAEPQCFTSGCVAIDLAQCTRPECGAHGKSEGQKETERQRDAEGERGERRTGSEAKTERNTDRHKRCM